MSASIHSRRHRLAATVCLATSLAAPAFASAQSLMGAPIGSGSLAPSMIGNRVAVDLGTQDTEVRTLSLPRGKSATIDLPRDARDVIVSDPKVADVVLSTPRRIFVLGVGSGQTDAAFMDAGGRQILRINIRVDQDISALSETLSRILPRSSIRVDSVNDSLILSGEVPDAASADKAVRVAGAFVAKPEQVINMLGVAQSEQVALKVKVIEVNRTVIKQLGFNLNAITGQLGMPQYSFGNSPTYGVNGSYLGGASGGYAVNTTSQPVSAYPFSSAISGLLSSLSGSSSITSVASAISNYLAGGGGLTSAQSGYANSYVSNIIGTTTTQITPNTLVNGVSTAGASYTATANLVGVNSGNIASLEQAYLNGGTLTDPQRLWLSQFNSNLNDSYSNPAKYSLSSAQNSLFGDRSNPANPVVTGRAGSTGLNQANALIQAFERTGLVRTLAEQTLTSVSGESAKFLAGGEFPVPVAVDATGRISAEFKPYGVGIGFTPVVLSSGLISIKLSTEVSELTSIGAIQLQGGGSSLSLPGLNVRRGESTVELPSGGAIMMAGLIQSQTKQTLDSLPGLEQVPVIGAPASLA